MKIISAIVVATLVHGEADVTGLVHGEAGDASGLLQRATGLVADSRGDRRRPRRSSRSRPSRSRSSRSRSSSGLLQRATGLVNRSYSKKGRCRGGRCRRGLLQHATGLVADSRGDSRRRRRRRRRRDSSSPTTTAAPTPATPAPLPRCAHYDIGSPAHGQEKVVSPYSTYKSYLKDLDIKKLYAQIVRVMTTSQSCWPADGPQDGDFPSYAGLFIRNAWHCAGTFRLINGKGTGGCEGGRNRFWPESEWRDNAHLDKSRAILAEIKSMPEYHMLSWGDLMTFAGTVAIKESGGPATKFCFGRIDDSDGRKSIMLGSEGTTQCELGHACVSHGTGGKKETSCENHWQWPDQDPSDHVYCKLQQAQGRQQASHSVGLIYVFPEGPKLKNTAPDYVAGQVHQRSPKLSAKEVRDTFRDRMGWTDQETVALIGGGHTLGRNHGNCAATNTPCLGEYTKTSGFEGAWTSTPSKWNYEYFEGMAPSHKWVATKSPDGEDQWGPYPGDSVTKNTVRLTSDLALIADPKYRKWVTKYRQNSNRFDRDFALAWKKLTHRSERHPHVNDLEKDVGTCTEFNW